MDPLKRPTRKPAPLGADVLHRQEMVSHVERIIDLLNSQPHLFSQMVTSFEQALASLRLPAPHVEVQADPPDLTPLLDAIADLAAHISRIPAPRVVTPDEIKVWAENPLHVEVTSPVALDAPTIAELAKAVKNLRGAAQAFTGGGSYGPVVTKLDELNGTLLDILAASGGPVPDKQVLMDYAGRSDTNPVYVGEADQGTATSLAQWTVKRLTYDASARLTEKQELSNVKWDDRATLGWSTL